MSGRRWDAAVIGGGPAGCSAAIALARQGFSVLLLEALRYPHEKVCGEFLSPEGVARLRALLPDDPALFAQVPSIRRFRLSEPGGALWEGSLPGEALSISRSALDDALQRRARRVGVQVCEAARVTAVRGNLADGFELDLQGEQAAGPLRARAVLGAYGRRSPLDAALGRAFMRNEQAFMALKAHFSGPSLEDRIELHAFPGGYCGLSDIEGGRRNVCLLVSQPVFQRAALGTSQPVEQFIAWMRSQNARLDAWFRSAGRLSDRWMAIAQVPFERKELVVGDVLMAGDAAGVIAPLAGDGISMALETGALSAALLAPYLAGRLSREELVRGYPRRWRQAFDRRLRLGALLQPLLLHPTAARLSVRLFNAFPALGAYFVARTRGDIAPGVRESHREDEKKVED